MLNAWYEETAGRKLAAVEAALVRERLQTFFGYYILQLGDSSPNDYLASSTISQHLYVSDQFSDKNLSNEVQSIYTQLPFANDSVDVVLLPHLLENIEDPQSVLEEVWRIMMPEGHVIILGFNPWSLLGLLQACHRNIHEVLPPFNQWVSLNHMRKLLNQSNFEVLEEKTYFFRPPVKTESTLKKLRFLEIIGEIFWSYSGNAYIIVAKKKVFAPTLIIPNWREQPVPVKELATRNIETYKQEIRK